MNRKDSPSGPRCDNTWARECGVDLVLMQLEIFLCNFLKLAFAE